MNSQTQGTLATSPDTGFVHEDDAVAVTSQHRTGSSIAHRATPVAAGVPAVANAALVYEVNSL